MPPRPWRTPDDQAAPPADPVLAAALLLPAAATYAQAEVEADASVAPEAVAPEAVAGDDTSLDELRALVPENLAGLPLRENLQVATGEQSGRA